MRDLPASSLNPFPCECSCGAAFSVRLVGFRAAPRKAVNLAASFVSNSDRRSIKRLCAVGDLSVKGLRLTTDAITGPSVGEDVKISLVLDDNKRTKVEVAGTVRRVLSAKTQLTVGVEFQPVKAPAFDILESYTTS